MDQNTDIFKLVEEVENQKKASLDDIYSMLDNVENDTTSVIDVKAKVQSSDTVNIASTKPKSSSRVYKPALPKTVTFDTRFECFKALVEGADYGENNSPDYVEGHRKALEQVYQDAFNNQKDLYVVEARVNDEINRTTSKNTLYLKGYYDGLFYGLKALRQSKTLSMKKLADALTTGLR